MSLLARLTLLELALSWLGALLLAFALFMYDAHRVGGGWEVAAGGPASMSKPRLFVQLLLALLRERPVAFVALVAIPAALVVVSVAWVVRRVAPAIA